MLLNKRFSPRALASTQPHVRAICTSIIDSVAEKGECDFVVDVAAKLPTAVICEMMDIPREDWDLMYAIANMSVGASDPEYQIEGSVRATGKQAQQDAFDYFVKVIAKRRQKPGTDLVSAIVQGEIDGEKLDDIEVLFNCWLLIIAGNETTRNATSGGVLALIEHPDERIRIKQDQSVLPTAVRRDLALDDSDHASDANRYTRCRVSGTEDSRRGSRGGLECLCTQRRRGVSGSL
jgi:cytochrome P450